MSIYLSAIHRVRPPRGKEFPWSLPLLRDLEELEFRAPVTFLVGENGSGKSTLLEGLAAGARDLELDHTLAPARTFASAYRFVRKDYPQVKLFLRAEDVFGFTQRVERDMDELRAMEEDFRRELPNGSAGQARATGMVRGQRRALAQRYGEDPHARSHGETFLALLGSRVVPRGLYFLDEPETPLSPSRVLALLSLLKDRVFGQCQFIIATHSPMLMAFPEAEILLFENGAIRPVPYEEVEHVRITRDFLQNPARYLRHL